MSKLFRFLFIASLLVNAALLAWMGTKWMKRFHRQEWLLIQNKVTKTIQPKAYYFLGDSQLDNLFHSGAMAADAPLSNLAVPGFRARDLIATLKGLTPVQFPVRVFVLVGVNDFRSGADMEEVMNRYAELEALLTEKFPAADVVAISLLPVTEHPDINPRLSNELILQANQAIKQWCDRRQYHYLDAFGLLSRNGQLNPNYTYDGLHLNLAGNQQLAKLLGGFME